MTRPENGRAPAWDGHERGEQTGDDGVVSASHNLHHGTDTGDEKTLSRPAKKRAAPVPAVDWDSINAKIRERIDCHDLLAEAGISHAGDRYACPNPAHKGQDADPDLKVFRGDDGVHRWHCHACGERGDVFDLAQFLGMAGDFRDAQRMLAQRAGVDLPSARSASPPARPAKKPGGKEIIDVPAERIAEIRRVVVRYYTDEFTPECAGAKYLEARGISFEAAKAAGVGWIADSRGHEWDDLAEPIRHGTGKAPTQDEGLAAGLLAVSKRTGKVYFSGFRQRLLIPALDADGETVVSFALRTHEADSDGPKERAFKPTAIFGLDQLGADAPAPEFVLIVEGTTDYLTGRAAGVVTLALPGASNWKHAVKPDVLDRIGADVPLVVCFDADEAGRKYSASLVAKLESSGRRVLHVEPAADGADLNDCFRDGGDLAGNVRALLDGANSADPLRVVPADERESRAEKKSSSPAPASSTVNGVWGNADYLGKTENGRHKYRARKLTDIAARAAKILPAPILRCGAELFAPDPSKAAGVRWLDKPAALIAHMHAAAGAIRWPGGEDEEGVTLASKNEYFAHVLNTAESFDEISMAPHWPAMLGVFYAHPELPPHTGGKMLDRFLEFFRPNTPIDAAKLRALVKTPASGIAPGARPGFVIFSPGAQGSGKTAAVEKIAGLYGGTLRIKPGHAREPLSGQILSQAGRAKRILLLDNTTGGQRSPEIADLITAPNVEGDSKYIRFGSRPNLLTWCLTTNEIDLSTDLADRLFVIHLSRADTTAWPTWETDAADFIDAHRWEILADIVHELQAGSAIPTDAADGGESPGGERILPAPITARHSRFAAWDNAVLNTGPLAHLADAALAERLENMRATDGEADEYEAFTALVADILTGRAAPTKNDLPGPREIREGLRAERIAAIWNAANNTRESTTTITRNRLGAEIAKEKSRIPWLDRRHTRVGKVYVVNEQILVTGVTDGDGRQQSIRHHQNPVVSGIEPMVTDVTDKLLKTPHTGDGFTNVIYTSVDSPYVKGVYRGHLSHQSPTPANPNNDGEKTVKGGFAPSITERENGRELPKIAPCEDDSSPRGDWGEL